MLNRLHRFHGLGSLNQVYRRGATYRGKWFSLKCAPNARRTTYRCAVVVSRKVHKSAVVRNRIRRRLYELLREELADSHSNHDIVVTVFSDQVATAPHDKLVRAMHELVDAAGLR